MKNLFVKKSTEMVNGMLYLRKVTDEQAIEDLMVIDSLLGNDLYETQLLSDAIHYGAVADTIRVPILTDKRTWKKIKESGLRLIATSEKAVAC